jgi:hypothetical protein
MSELKAAPTSTQVACGDNINVDALVHPAEGSERSRLVHIWQLAPTLFFFLTLYGLILRCLFRAANYIQPSHARQAFHVRCLHKFWV